VKVVNGKLTDDRLDRVDEIQQDVVRITQQYQQLESQLVKATKQDYATHLVRCDRRIERLEKTILKLNQEMLFLKIGIVLCILSLGFIAIFKNTPTRMESGESSIKNYLSLKVKEGKGYLIPHSSSL
jgi:hypothetical protein